VPIIASISRGDTLQSTVSGSTTSRPSVTIFTPSANEPTAGKP
jgi:hypothetical protein